MTDAVKLLDVVALTSICLSLICGVGKWVQLLKSLQMVGRLKLNLAMPAAGCTYAQDALTNLLVCAKIKSWCYSLSQYRSDVKG